MKIIDLLNKIANGEKVPDAIKWGCHDFEWFVYEYKAKGELGEPTLLDYLSQCPQMLNDKIITFDKIEEKKIPEKHINNCGDLIILGQQDNWLEPTIETDQKINAQLNPYVFEAINENFKDIENKIYEIIDYLKSKGE